MAERQVRHETYFRFSLPSSKATLNFNHQLALFYEGSGALRGI